MSARESPSIPNKCRLLRTKEDFGAMFIKGISIGASRGPGKAEFGPRPQGLAHGKCCISASAAAVRMSPASKRFCDRGALARGNQAGRSRLPCKRRRKVAPVK
jgi:hypothetical protein